MAPNKAKVFINFKTLALFFPGKNAVAFVDVLHLFVLQAIHKLTEYLSFQVRNIAGELIDAFDLPDYVTRAPIARQSDAYAYYTQIVGF